MDSVGHGESGFDLARWRSAVYAVCRPEASWADISDWERDILHEDESNGDQSFSQGVALDTARGCLRLLGRLWATPGDRVGLELPERVLWRWLRDQIIGNVSAWTIDPNDSDAWTTGEPRKDAAIRLRHLLPGAPLSRREREHTQPYQRDPLEIGGDLEEAADVLDDLVATERAFYQSAEPWPTLATLDALVDQLTLARRPVPAAEPIGAIRPVDEIVLERPVMRTIARAGGKPGADFDRDVAEATVRAFRAEYGRAPSVSEVWAALPASERDRGKSGTFRSSTYYGKWKNEPGWGQIGTPAGDGLPDGLMDTSIHH